MEKVGMEVEWGTVSVFNNFICKVMELWEI